MKSTFIVLLLASGFSFCIQHALAQPVTDPTAAAPANHATNQPLNPTLQWLSLGVQFYNIDFARDSAFTDPVFDFNINANEEFLMIPGLEPNQTYYWRVRELTPAGTPPVWSSTFQFTTGHKLLTDPSATFTNFSVVANANGPLVPAQPAADESHGFPLQTELRQPDQNQQATTDAIWMIHTGGNRIPYYDGSTSDFVYRVARNDNSDFIGTYDWEWRFTGSTTCIRRFEDGGLVEAPFELWRIGIGTPNDTSDDVRMTCWILEEAINAGTDPLVFDLGGDHMMSDGDDDPYTDWIYWVVPDDETPGQAGYEADLALMQAGTYPIGQEISPGQEALARTVLVNLDGGATPPYTADLPEAGTIFRIETNKQDSLLSYPIPSAPLDRAVSQPDLVTLRWNPPPGYNRYEVQVAPTPRLDTLSRDSIILIRDNPWHVATGLSSGASYYWRVRAIRDNFFTAWSDIMAFTVGTEVDVEDEMIPFPNEVELKANFPNPFQHATTISFRLSKPTPVRLTIYDLLGRRVQTAIDGAYNAGEHSALLDASGLIPGVYIYQLETANHRITKRMILIR